MNERRFMILKEKTLPDSGTMVSKGSWRENVINYVLVRQNQDGGYAFAKGLESNVQDTYYALAILHLLGAPFLNIQRTIRWLHDYSAYNIYEHYYMVETLRLCSEPPSKHLRDFIESLIVSHREFGTIDAYAEIASEFEMTFMVTEIVNILGVKLDKDNMIKRLLQYKNEEGGFGAHGHSNSNSTYHAVASLFNLGYPVRSLKDTLAFIRSCEKPTGGFTVVPNTSPPYMEHAYYGVSTLDLLGENAKYPEKTAKFVFRCQNPNGGFARSDLGISTFEDTFYAVTILQKIGKL